MAKIECDIEDTVLYNDEYDVDVPGVTATCQRCGHSTESFGTGERSVRRCLAMLRNECPNGEHNFYVEAS